MHFRVGSPCAAPVMRAVLPSSLFFPILQDDPTLTHSANNSNVNVDPGRSRDFARVRRKDREQDFHVSVQGVAMLQYIGV